MLDVIFSKSVKIFKNLVQSKVFIFQVIHFFPVFLIPKQTKVQKLNINII